MRSCQIIILLTLSILSPGCIEQKKDMENTHKYSNQLIDESSPYLLQHAHNPVDWHPWNEQALAKALREEKLMLISIGYAACHWCHVMEHESFEDEEVAAYMNAHFVNIKVDREERPDIDQIYIGAVELMTGRAGWPLNVITLPDGRPVWGGTYFPKEAWMQRLAQIQTLYENDPKKLVEYARRLASGIKAMDLIEVSQDTLHYEKVDISSLLERWGQKFDPEYGGYKGAPKFMLPNNFRYLQRHAWSENDTELKGFVSRTLHKMAYGGIYDHIGGGFSRYSVDDRWHIPHFEKMLYDNAQLVQLYSEAYQLNPLPLYRKVIEETIAFVAEELTAPNAAFYSSLDADSLNEEGQLEEGAYYTYTRQELEQQLGADFELFSTYYNINDFGHWEDNRYVLITTRSDNSIWAEFSLLPEELENRKQSWKHQLKAYREKREKPRLDDKSLTSWNAMMTTALVKAYQALEKGEYLDLALRNAEFIARYQQRDDGGLYHSYKNGKSTINGYLEDYAAVIQAYIALHEVTLNPSWLQKAGSLSSYAFEKFFDRELSMFYFTSADDRDLVSRPLEYRDNVIPSSNSVMANNLFLLSHYLNKPEYKKVAMQMLNNVIPELERYPGSFSNWLWLVLNLRRDFYQVVITGTEAGDAIRILQKEYFPNVLYSGSTFPSDDFLLKNRFVKGKTMIYLCVDNICHLPTEKILKTIKTLTHGRG